MNSDLAAALVVPRISTRRLGGAYHFHESVDSTNRVALELLAGGAPHGTLVVADEQTAGRGRRGRAWHSPKGLALYASLVLRPADGLPEPPLLVAAVALGLAEGIERATGVPTVIKWPNDLWVEGRKVAGILLESRGSKVADGLVAGFGVNVSHRASDFPEALRATATSVALHAATTPTRANVLLAALSALEPRLDCVFAGRDAAALERDYRERSVLLGRRVRLLDGDLALEGVVLDLSARGGLLLRGDSGLPVHVRAEHVGDVRLV